jgi:hypothetical protein
MDLVFSFLLSFAGSPGRYFLTTTRNTIVVLVDFFTWLRYRTRGLNKYQRLFVSPGQIEFGYESPPPHHFGVVRHKHWDRELVPVEFALGGVPLRCRQRIQGNLSWKATGEIDLHMAKKKQNGNISPEGVNRIHDRYQLLDKIIDELSRSRYFRSREELERRTFREKGGVGVIVNRDGSLALCDGHHRFGIAHALKIDTIPVALYAVHPSYVESGAWEDFFRAHRHRPKAEGDATKS